MDEKALEQIIKRLDRLEAVNACRNIMGRYSYYHTAFRNYDYMNLWAKRDDSYFIFPYGEYRGYEAIYRCYVVEHGDRSDPGMGDSLKGMMMMHQLDTEVLEVAEDGLTAKGCWISPGHETVLRSQDGGPAADKSGDCSEYKADPMWAWSKYEVEFIKEPEGWRLWHMRLYPLFKTNFYVAWTDGEEVIEGATGQSPSFTGQEPPKFWQWDKNAVYPADEPEPPTPYKSYEDMPHKIL